MTRTKFLSRLIGLYCVLVGLSMLVRKQTTIDAATALIHSAPLVLVLGEITLVIGLAIVVGHNVWSGGALSVIVTLVGWVATIKGLIFLFLSPAEEVSYFAALRYAQLFYLYVAITLVLGVYLTYGGFRSTSR